MSFTNIEKQPEKIKINLTEKSELNNIDSERCTRTYRYSVNRRTGSRRLIGCSDWDCDGGMLDEVQL